MARYPLGRLAPHPEDTHPRMHAARVLARGYNGPIPGSCDYYSGVTFPEYLNQSLGDCTAADVGHAEQVFSTFGQGATVTVTDQDVLALYEATSGYNPADPSTDQGAVIQDVLDYWRKTGIAGHRILAFFQVDHTSQDEIRSCCWLFGGVTVGVNFPNSGFTQFDQGQPWNYDASADNTIAGGHDFRIVGYNRTTGLYDGVSWGQLVEVTWSWLQAFAEEMWSEADGQWVKNNASPEGLDVNALNSAFTDVTGQPGPFPVVPPPTPGPTPVPPGPTPGPPGPVVDDVDRALWAAVQPALTHLSHHGAARTVHDAITAWHKSKGF